ncbi:MAG: hypothetical protein ABSE05_00165 [Syntrophales bacterium]|jgi:NAD(P)-dependent dehydrogenase (short-subunit alcohol dehydrogenase family)
MNLESKPILVTDLSSGIGRETALLACPGKVQGYIDIFRRRGSQERGPQRMSESW